MCEVATFGKKMKYKEKHFRPSHHLPGASTGPGAYLHLLHRGKLTTRDVVLKFLGASTCFSWLGSSVPPPPILWAEKSLLHISYPWVVYLLEVPEPWRPWSFLHWAQCQCFAPCYPDSEKASHPHQLLLRGGGSVEFRWQVPGPGVAWEGVPCQGWFPVGLCHVWGILPGSVPGL